MFILTLIHERLEPRTSVHRLTLKHAMFILLSRPHAIRPSKLYDNEEPQLHSIEPSPPQSHFDLIASIFIVPSLSHISLDPFKCSPPSARNPTPMLKSRLGSMSNLPHSS